MSKLPRIAFVTRTATSYSNRLIRGMSQAARDPRENERRFILRDFEMGTEAMTPPASFHVWKPDAMVTWLDPDLQDVFSVYAQAGTPLVSCAKQAVRANEAVVAVDAVSQFDAIHDHFRGIGVNRVVQFLLGPRVTQQLSAQYRAYCEANGYSFEQFVIADELIDDVNYHTPKDPPDIPRELQRWLEGLPKPVGVFTQTTLVGPYLVRVCKALGIVVPEDVAIIGADGFDVSLWCEPAMTSTQLSVEAVGQEAAELALQMIAGIPNPSEIVSVGQASIIARGSTTRVREEGVHIRAAMDLIDRYACEGIRVQDVVELTQSVTRRTFGKYFKEWTGQTPVEALRNRKLAEAKRLLRETDLSITTLSRACGFCDDIEFRKVFGKHEGCSPTAYREDHRT